jgi:hypothetical protein
MKHKTILLTAVFVCFIGFSVFSQVAREKEGSKRDIFHLGADIMSHYMWRGSRLSKAPNIQPTVYFESQFGLKAGAWGSYSVTGDYTETDLFLAYAIKGVSITLTDYFVMNEDLADNKYFNYSSSTTGHQFEAMLGYNGPDKVPLYIQIATIFYGFDKKLDKTVIDTVTDDTTHTYKSQFSTYIEVGYTIRNFTLFIGFTPWGGLYGNTLGVVNLGLTARKEIRITDKFSLPVQASVITNPQQRNIHFVFGITL